jgi:hypothetical protein
MTKQQAVKYYKKTMLIAKSFHNDFKIGIEKNSVAEFEKANLDINQCYEMLYLSNYFLKNKKYKNKLYNSIKIADYTLSILNENYPEACFYSIILEIKKSADYRKHKINNILY